MKETGGSMDTVRTFLFRYGTPFTAGLFLVSAVSGVALYFGWSPGLFHEMHEVLSMILLVPVVLHLWRNSKPLTGYFRRLAMPAAIAISLAAGGYYAATSLGNARGGNPAMAFLGAAEAAPISALAPVLKLDADAAVKRLTDAGLGPVAADDTVASIAARTGKNAMEIVAKLTAATSGS